MQTLTRLWNDDAGAIVSAELILVATILVLGMIVGLTTLRDQVVQELGDVAAAVASANQSFSFSGITGHHSSVAGSLFIDLSDDCDEPDPICMTNDVSGAPAVCISICGIGATPEGG
jgi:Flp pilus assembly pilin Flp